MEQLGLFDWKPPPDEPPEIDLAHCMNEQSARNEDNDCVIRALSIAAQMPYSEVWQHFKNLGRRRRCGIHYGLWRPYMKRLFPGLKLLVAGQDFEGKTVNALEAELGSRNVYIVETRRHLLCIRNGKAQDWTTGRRHRPIKVWRVS